MLNNISWVDKGLFWVDVGLFSNKSNSVAGSSMCSQYYSCTTAHICVYAKQYCYTTAHMYIVYVWDIFVSYRMTTQLLRVCVCVRVWVWVLGRCCTFANICIACTHCKRTSVKLLLKFVSCMRYTSWYGVAMMSRLLTIICFFCRISSLLKGSFAKETYNFKEHVNRSSPTSCRMGTLPRKHTQTHSHTRTHTLHRTRAHIDLCG